MTDVTGFSARGDVGPPYAMGGEKETLAAFLGYLREAVIAKAAGLTDEVGLAPGVPSGTSLLGLVKHLTRVERNWFGWAYAGLGHQPLDDDEPPRPGETGEALIAAYQEAIRASDETIAACDDLDRTGARSLRDAEPPTMRWILVHMIEETARHAGHADILREQTDGATGR
ncbi:DinB family protein [Streptomyces smyrnaeus]|uniref:DinB family protein n=1 Tax=Streptomyces TaxID=1883 RepID=UPI000C18205E|nr:MULTISPECIES: DinB family protein [unclassified Streptomyces]MBQ0863360.1 DinB family protein [Streptomyces sp. RK75]MBQ1122706.1 DinB family protein [Streptomyces sp. B15]